MAKRKAEKGERPAGGAKKKALFRVEGPYKVPCYQGDAGRCVTQDEGIAFFKLHEHVRAERGCYVFAMQTGGGSLPVYVGKATKTFGQEAFDDHKLSKYNKCLADYKKGSPVMFFVVLPKKKGKPNTRAIGELETFLIQAGQARNGDLLNRIGLQREPSWAIKSLTEKKPGKRTKAASGFAKMIGID